MLLLWTVNRRKMGQTVPGVGKNLIFMPTLKHFTVCSEGTHWHSKGDKYQWRTWSPEKEKGPCWEVKYARCYPQMLSVMNNKAVMRMRQISTQTFYALVKPVSMMAWTKKLEENNYFWINPHFFHFLPSKTNSKEGWPETKYFVFSLFSPSLFYFC